MYELEEISVSSNGYPPKSKRWRSSKKASVKLKEVHKEEYADSNINRYGCYPDAKNITFITKLKSSHSDPVGEKGKPGVVYGNYIPMGNCELVSSSSIKPIKSKYAKKIINTGLYGEVGTTNG